MYPKWKYHPDLGSLIVHTSEEEARLEGWFDSPAEFGVITAPSAEQSLAMLTAELVDSPSPDVPRRGRPRKAQQ